MQAYIWSVDEDTSAKDYDDALSAELRSTLKEYTSQVIATLAKFMNSIWVQVEAANVCRNGPFSIAKHDFICMLSPEWPAFNLQYRHVVRFVRALGDEQIDDMSVQPRLVSTEQSSHESRKLQLIAPQYRDIMAMTFAFLQACKIWFQASL